MDDWFESQLRTMTHKGPEDPAPTEVEPPVVAVVAAVKDTDAKGTEDPVQSIRDLAIEETGSKEKVLYALNIGTYRDQAIYYRLCIALSDFIFYRLRRSFGMREIDGLSWKLARETLMAAGFLPSGKSRYAMRTDSATSEAIERERTSVEASVQVLVQARDELGGSNPELADRMTRSLESLGVFKHHATTDESVKALIEEGLALAPDVHRSRILRFIDEFQRFTSLAEDGEILNEEYQKLAKEWFGVTEGSEIGYSILSMLEKGEGESHDAFITRHRAYAIELTKKIRDKLSYHPQLSRLSLHPCVFGEVMPIGYVPDDEVVGIDEKGVARTIFSLATHVPSSKEGERPAI